MKVDKVDITFLHSMMRKFYGNEFLGISTDDVLLKRGTLLWNGEWKANERTEQIPHYQREQSPL